MLMKRSHIKGIYIYVIHAYSCNSRRICRLTETNDYTWSLFSGFHNTSKSILTANSYPKVRPSERILFVYFILCICCLKKNPLECIFHFHCWSFIVRRYFRIFEVHFKNFFRFNIIVIFEKSNRESRNYLFPFSFFFFFWLYFWIIKKFYSRSLF